MKIWEPHESVCLHPRMRRLFYWRICASLGLNELTYWCRDKMAAISQTIFSKVFSRMKMIEFRLIFHWSLFPIIQLILFRHWFRWFRMAWCCTGDNSLSEPMVVSLLLHICVARSQWVLILDVSFSYRIQTWPTTLMPCTHSIIALVASVWWMVCCNRINTVVY